MTLAASIDQKMYASEVGGPMMGRYRQRANEVITYSVSYDRWLDPSDSISAINSFQVSLLLASSAVVDTPPVIAGQVISLGREVLFTVAGGVIGSKYEIIVSVQTTSGELKNDFFQVTIGRLTGAVAGSGTVYDGGVAPGQAAPSPPLTVKANVTNASAFAQDASISAVLDMISAVQGSVLYRSAFGWVFLPPGQPGQVIMSGGPGDNIYWGVLPSRTVSSAAPSGIPLDGQEWVVVP